MLRKTIFAITASAAIGAAALTPTVALAGGGGGPHIGHGFGWGHGYGFGGFGIAVVQPAVTSCWRSQLVETRYGTLRRVLVNVCDY